MTTWLLDPALTPSLTFQIEQSKVVVNEDSVQVTLTIVDTPGFGNAVDNSDWSVAVREGQAVGVHVCMCALTVTVAFEIYICSL